MSIPSSRLLVQMTPLVFPSLRLFSTASRVARERELWWMPMGSFWSQTLNLFARASASLLVLVNISTDLYFSTISLITLSRAATSGKVKIVSAKTLSSAVGSGLVTVSSRLFSTGTLTMSHSPA